jgi:hypothetical protein
MNSLNIVVVVMEHVNDAMVPMAWRYDVAIRYKPVPAT